MNQSKSVMLSLGHPCHTAIGFLTFFFMTLLLYSIRLYISITKVLSLALSTWYHLFCWYSQWMAQKCFSVTCSLFVCIPWCGICFCLNTLYNSLHKYTCITTVTNTWFKYSSLAFDLNISTVCYTHIIIYLSPVFLLNCDG